jgi:peptide/nickel transport system permease protein
MVIEAGLPFLGIGMLPPTSSWDAILNEAPSVMTSAPASPSSPVSPSLCRLSCNLLGDGVRDALDPRLVE